MVNINGKRVHDWTRGADSALSCLQRRGLLSIIGGVITHAINHEIFNHEMAFWDQTTKN